MFNSKYNRSWDSMKKTTSQRGALQFYNLRYLTPQIYNFPIGYYGLGLEVLTRYGNN